MNSFTRILVASLLPLSLSPLARADEAPPQKMEVREFRLQHADVKEVNAIVRSLFDVRKSAVDERRQSLILRDSPDALDEAARLIALLDVAPTPWQARLVAEVAGREVAIREVDLSQGDAVLGFGSAGGSDSDRISIRLDVRDATGASVDIAWAINVTFPDRPGRSSWFESADAVDSIGDGDGLVLVTTSDPARRAALGHLLGLDGPVSSLKLEADRPRRR